MCCLTLHFSFPPCLPFSSPCPTLVTFTCSLLISPCSAFTPLVFASSLCQCNFTEAYSSSSLTFRCLSASHSHQTAVRLWPPAVFLCSNEFSQAEFILRLVSLFGSLSFWSLFSFPRAGLMLEGATHSYSQKSFTQKMPLPCVSVTHPTFFSLPHPQRLKHSINAGIPCMKC